MDELRKDQEVVRDNLAQAERKATAAFNEAEEARTLLEISERQKRQLDHEFNALKDSLQDAIVQSQALSSAKRSAESEIANLRYISSN